MGQPSDAVTGVPFFFLHFHLKIEEKKKVGTPVNQASRRWLHHVGPTVSAWFFLLLLFPFARGKKREKTMKEKEDTARLFPHQSSYFGRAVLHFSLPMVFSLTVSWVPEFTRMMVSSFLLPHWRVNSRPIEDG